MEILEDESCDKLKMIKIGIVGSGRIANRFIPEANEIKGISIEGVFGRNIKSIEKFQQEYNLKFYTFDYEVFLKNIDAVYIASPHLTHYNYIKRALENGKHVLCEKPMVLYRDQAIELYKLAKEKELILMEAIKTAYAPGFIELVKLLKSDIIGSIKAIDATFTKLENRNNREFDENQAGGSLTELGTYPLYGILKILGTDVKNINYYSYNDQEKRVDLFTKINLMFEDAIATANVGLGVKSEGNMIISGTKGYIYVEAPWWKTSRFEVKFEDISKNFICNFKYEDDGLRYEIQYFYDLINKTIQADYDKISKESIKIAEIIENFRDNKLQMI